MKITKEEVRSQKGAEMKAVVCFKETDLKAIFNTTNLKAAAEIFGTPYYEDWVGKKITLISETHTFFGKSQRCLRVKK